MGMLGLIWGVQFTMDPLPGVGEPPPLAVVQLAHEHGEERLDGDGDGVQHLLLEGEQGDEHIDQVYRGHLPDHRVVRDPQPPPPPPPGFRA